MAFRNRNHPLETLVNNRNKLLRHALSDCSWWTLCPFVLLWLGLPQAGISQPLSNNPGSFEIYTKRQQASILYDRQGTTLDSIAAYLLAEDIARISGFMPLVTTDKSDIQGNIIVIGVIGSDLINTFLDKETLPEEFNKQKESFHLRVNPSDKVLIVAGTDARGTAYGVFELSEKIGTSPWYWWADIPVKKQEKIIVQQPDFYSKEPSVEFRGIFLNDEDWGLQPWAEKTFEPEIGDIGPKTYSKIFELLLRLKANTIWPAMHPSTKAFFHYPGNPETAKKYHIVIGSSHAEPMLRNNVDEWNIDTMGTFNYLSNRENVYNYWEERVKQTKDLDAIYTLGMRGIHDSGMEGVKGIQEATVNLQNVLNDQRTLLETYSNKAVTQVPQAFTVYKEVLEIYDHGLQLPEDVTIVWSDDNYGYIRRLGNEKERARSGGSGVYYHVSYWGRPHDYQWLSTTHPGLIREEMMKAYQTDSRKMWILNVGDLKPAEYNIQFFLDMAYDAEQFQDPSYVEEHMRKFYSNAFGAEKGNEIAELKTAYYHLAFERKPEFMGWSQTEPTTGIATTSYDPFSWGDEVGSRIERYSALEKKVNELKEHLDTPFQDAFFQLVYYPVKGASFMNKKFLYRDLAIKYASEKRLVSQEYKELSHRVFDSIRALTNQYNSEVAQGKWKYMMDMAPRRLPVFDKPEIVISLDGTVSEIAGISVENNSKREDKVLPAFYKNSDRTHFFDVFLKQDTAVDWSVVDSPAYVMLSEQQGQLTKQIQQQRISVKIDWEAWEKAYRPNKSELIVTTGSKQYTIGLDIIAPQIPVTGGKVFSEENGIVVMYAENYTDKTDHGNFKWNKLPGLGYSHNLMKSVPVTENPLDTLHIEKNSPYLKYTIHTESTTDNAELILNALPSHPLTNQHSLRIGVQWDNGPVEIIDFRTYGREELWKQNVLRNLARKAIPIKVANKGEHTLKIYMIDEGVYLDFFYLKLKDFKLPYSLLPETLYTD